VRAEPPTRRGSTARSGPGASSTAAPERPAFDRLPANSEPSPAGDQRPRPLEQRRAAGEPDRTVGHRVPPIVVDRLVKAYNGVVAVRNLSFTVEPGRITGFLGPNGAGKTTTLRILVGLVSPTTGSATFGGTAYADLNRPQETVGAVLDANFHPGRTGRNHLRVLAATAGVTDRRVDQLLERVGLTAEARRPTGQYSLGMRQRLAIAAALIGNPDYLILDEPANGLDPEGIRWLRQMLRDFAATGRAVLVSSHLLNEVQATVDEIVVIHKGRLLAQMPMSDLHLGQGTIRARVSDLDTAGQVLGPLGVRVEWVVDEQGPYLRVHSQEVAAVGAALFNAGIVVHELVTERRDLEQEFFAMLEASR
jgi:ABC-2 type transport system ATP-binding protein